MKKQLLGAISERKKQSKQLVLCFSGTAAQGGAGGDDNPRQGHQGATEGEVAGEEMWAVVAESQSVV